MNITSILEYLKSIAPEDTAMANDPVGLLIEPLISDITSIVVCLDATTHVVEFARKHGAQLIVAHHPLIYHPLKRLDQANPTSATVLALARGGIGLYAMHTNWDIAEGGVNDTLASMIGLLNIRPLSGAPIARIGVLNSPLSPDQFIDLIAKSLRCIDTNCLRSIPTHLASNLIQVVAVCGGAGASLMPHAIAADADAFLTSDVRHDQFIDASGHGLMLIDAGHQATEAPGMETLAQLLETKFASEVAVSFCSNWKEFA